MSKDRPIELTEKDAETCCQALREVAAEHKRLAKASLTKDETILRNGRAAEYQETEFHIDSAIRALHEVKP